MDSHQLEPHLQIPVWNAIITASAQFGLYRAAIYKTRADKYVAEFSTARTQTDAAFGRRFCMINTSSRPGWPGLPGARSSVEGRRS